MHLYFKCVARHGVEPYLKAFWRVRSLSLSHVLQRGGVGISQGALSTALNGNPTIDKLQEIADIIGVTLSELVADEAQGLRLVCPHCGKPLNIELTRGGGGM